MSGIKQIIYKGIKTGYFLDLHGNVYNSKTHKFIKPYFKDAVGMNGKYLKIGIYINGNRYKLTYSRELLKAFRPHPNQDSLECGHKDDNHLNNLLDNLIWQTKEDNLKQMRRRNYETI
jgi:hypothetical protein